MGGSLSFGTMLYIYLYSAIDSVIVLCVASSLGLLLWRVSILLGPWGLYCWEFGYTAGAWIYTAGTWVYTAGAWVYTRVFFIFRFETEIRLVPGNWYHM